VSVKACGDEVGLAAEFGVAHKFHVAKIFCSAVEDEAVRGDECSAKQGKWDRGGAWREEFMAKEENENAADRPRAEAGDVKGGAYAGAPEFCERMQDEPIERDREVEKENEQREIAEESHAA
jgi:hypothetical protein